MPTPQPPPPEKVVATAPRAVDIDDGGPAKPARRRRAFSVAGLLLAFAGQVLAAAMVAGGTIFLSARVGLAPERGLAV
ncbi:MAG: hypothetical protein ACK4N5_20980, partial [Myxococcales bacterium]